MGTHASGEASTPVTHTTFTPVAAAVAPAPASPSGDKWACRLCSYENNSMYLSCAMCNNWHLDDEVDDKWECARCSFRNEVGWLMCGACKKEKGAERPPKRMRQAGGGEWGAAV